MPTDKKELLYDYVQRIHGPISRDTFDAIFAGATHLHVWGSVDTAPDDLFAIVRDNIPRSYGPGQRPMNPFE
jgi:hypothetical protein